MRSLLTGARAQAAASATWALSLGSGNARGIGVVYRLQWQTEGPVMRQQLGSAALRAYEDLWVEGYGACLNLLNQAKTTKEAEQ